MNRTFVIYSFIYLFTYSFIYSFIHSFIHSFIYLFVLHLKDDIICEHICKLLPNFLTEVKGAVMQIEKALINDRLHVLRLP